MKRTVCLLLAVLMLALALSACAQKKEGLICGVTLFEPMNYQEADGTWTGFDTEFAKLVADKLGVDVKFQPIDWDNKFFELEAGTINCIWNGFTANANEADGTPRSDHVDFSYSYMLNEQCIVVKAENAAEYTGVEALNGKTIVAEGGSAGETFAKENAGDGGTVLPAGVQIDTFVEVSSGAADCAVIDVLLAREMVGSGSYTDLVIAPIEMASEVYAIGFAKGSDLTAKVNQAIVELFESGEMETLAAKYDLVNSLMLDTTFKG
ncbi:MAG: transporter substrate-binding domain-containing protein [Oscillospiraceae bacterium]|nr:transporter substrate-binding domain-containing protein [Oscillospiraceae bacterium]